MTALFQDSRRILYVIGQLGAGGSERQLWYLLRTMDRERYRPAVAVWGGSPEDNYASLLGAIGVPVHYLSPGQSAYTKLRELRKLVYACQPEVAHSYSFYTNFCAGWAARGSNAVVIGSLRNDYRAECLDVGIWRARLCSHWPGVIVANSRSAAAACGQDNSFWRPRRMLHVANGIDMETFPVNEPPPTAPLVIVGIGRLYPQKRWDILLKALAHLTRVTACPWQCRIFGDGALRDELVAMADRLGLGPKVQFPGFCRDVAGALASAHVLALTSDYEGTPNVVLEAMACGRPVVASAVGAVPEIVEDNVSGFVTPPGDAIAVADRLRIIAEDPTLRVRMGIAARARVSTSYSLETLVNNTFLAYEECGWTGR